MSSKIDLNNKLTPPDRIAEAALDDPQLLQELLNGVMPQSQKSARRENCSQALMFMAEAWPETLLPHWDHFIQLCQSKNGFSKYVAVYVIASLTGANPALFEKDFEKYFALLDDESVMVASHAAWNSARIARACPALAGRITQELLQIDSSHHDASHLALVKAYIVEALTDLYPTSTMQPQIMKFVQDQLNSQSPKTVKLAKAFLKKFG